MTGIALDQAALAALKTAVKLLLADVGGGVAAASACRVGPPQLSDYANREHPDRGMPIDVVAALEAVGGQPRVTAALAALAGYALRPVTPIAVGDVPALLARVGEAAGGVFAEAARALADGRISAGERPGLLHKLRELERAAAVAISALHGEAK
ncbi:hypothetical protein [Sandarakinorhabdus sp.]|uniref:hypothetical protein n=1 Tax=Sandarakinorhabdus sp. TaxID=1916663 RepID=UPI003566B4E8